MNKIRCISEAFSMQPNYHWIGRNGVVEIKAETVVIGREYGHPIEQARYIGYNDQGQELFSFVATAVNVQYEPELLETKKADEGMGAE